MKKRNFFRKILYAYILLILVYTIVAVGLYFYKSNEINTYKINNNQILSLKQFKERADSKFSEGFKLINQLYSNNQIIKYINNDELDYYNITESFYTVSRYPSDEIAVIGISKLDNLVISSYGTLDVKNYFKEIGYKAKKEAITGLKYNEYYIFSSLEVRTDKELLTIVKKYIGINKPPTYFFISYYKDNIFPIVEENEGNYAIIDQNKFVAGSGKSKIKWSNILNENITNMISNAENSQKINNSKYTIRYANSERLKGLNYIYASPRTIASNSIKNLLYGSIMIYLILIVSGIIVAFYYSRYVYSPISEILNLFKELNKEKIDNNQDEFSYIQENIKSIRQANLSLRNTIKNNSISLKTKFLRELTYGLIPADIITTRAKMYNIHIFDNKTSIIVLELINYQYLNEEFTREAILKINNDILLILSEQLKNKNCEVFELSYKQYGIFIEEDNITEIKNILNKALAAINTSCELEMVAAIGQAVKRKEDLHLSAYSVLEMLEHRSPTDKRLILSYDQKENLEHGSYYYPLEVEGNIINYVIKGKVNDVKILLKTLLKRNLETQNMDREVRSELIFAIIGTIYRILHKINIKTKQLFNKDDLFNELQRIKNKQDLEEKIIKIFIKISESINTEKEDQEKTFTDQLVGYIEEYYAENLSLVDLAEEFNYSTGYISRLFKSHVKENFKDYLNRYRISKAKEFLEQDPKRKIKDVAEMVGYSTVTFIRNFKKYEGISPGQYLEK